MKFHIQHQTTFHYQKPVSFGDHYIYLRPQDGPSHRVLSFDVRCDPKPEYRCIRDCYNNLVRVANFGLTQYSKLQVDCDIVLDVEEENPFNFTLDTHARSFPFRYKMDEQDALEPYLKKDAIVGAEHVLDWFYEAVPNPNQSQDLVQFLVDINQAIRNQIVYQRRDEEGIQEPDETLKLGKGTCRDMAVLFIAICQQLGFAVRFVSGYLYVPTDDEDYAEYNQESAAGSMHAWAEVYLPGGGWKGFDPTNGVLANHFSIPTAVATRAEAINPIQGKYFNKGAVDSTMRYNLKIECA